MYHPTRFLLRISLLMLALLLTGISVQAQQNPPPLTLDGRTPGDGFGSAVTIDGDTALISADNGIYHSLHIFVRNGTTWSHQAKLETSDGIPLLSGDLDGDTAVGIDPGNGELTHGGLYVFVRSGTTWTQQAKLETGADYPHDYFTDLSGPVALDGDTLIAPASNYNPNPDSVDIFVFKRSGTVWTRDTVWSLPEGGVQLFGLALSGDLAAVLNVTDTGTCEPIGDLLVYEQSGGVWNSAPGWTGCDPGDPETPGSSGNFGAVDLSGNTLVSNGFIYDYNSDPFNLFDAVFVYVQNGGTWSRQALLKPVNNQGHHYYNNQVTIDGDTLSIMVEDPDTGDHQVIVYVRSGTTWTRQAVITNDHLNYPYGGRMALSGNTILVGAVAENAAYVYVRNGSGWSQQAKLTLGAESNVLLINGGFEVASGSDSLTPSGWKLKGSPSVKRDCAAPAFDGYCSLSFEHGSYKAAQNVDLNTFHLEAGDKLKLTGFYSKWGLKSYVANVWLYVSYANLPEQQVHISLKKSSGGWQELPKIAVTLKAQPTRVRVVLQATADAQGMTRFDNIDLSLVTPAFKQAKQAGQPELLPAPLP